MIRTIVLILLAQTFNPVAPIPVPTDVTLEHATSLPVLTTGKPDTVSVHLFDLRNDVALLQDRQGGVFLISPAGPSGPFPFPGDVLIPTEGVRVDPSLAQFGGRHRLRGEGKPGGDGVHLYLGRDRAAWTSGLKILDSIRVDELAPGIDLEYRATPIADHFKLVVSPGADPKPVAVRFGSSGGMLDDNGNLVTKDRQGRRVRHGKPEAWQSLGAAKQVVPAEWDPSFPAQIMAEIIKTGPYDATRELIIEFDIFRYGLKSEPEPEPVVLGPIATAVDSRGNVYAVGRGNASAVFGVYPLANGGPIGSALVVRKFRSDGTLLYTTFIGAADNENSKVAISATPDGTVYVASSAAGPKTPLTHDCAGDCSGPFIAKLGIDGTLLDAAIVPRYDTAVIAVDSKGFLYLAGNRAGQEAYLVRIDPLHRPESHVYDTVLPFQYPRAMAIDHTGNIVVAGIASAETHAPSGWQKKFGGGTTDGFIARFNPSTSGSASLLSATFIGGSGSLVTEDEDISAVATDDAGNVYVGGKTTAADFPVTRGAYQTDARGASDAFVAKLDPSLQRILWATRLGGNGEEKAVALGIDEARNVYAGGHTDSPDFPIVRSPWSSSDNRGREHRAFVAKLNSAGSAVSTSMFIGRVANPGMSNFGVHAGTAYLGVLSGQGRLPHLPPDATHELSAPFSVLGIGTCASCPPAPLITNTRVSGRTLTIEGDHFANPLRVLVDGEEAGVLSATQKTVRAKLSASELPIEITVINPDHQSASASPALALRFVSTPVIAIAIFAVVLIGGIWLVRSRGRRRRAG